MFLSGVPLPLRVILLGRPGAELLHEREEVGHAPVLSDLAVAYAHDVDGLELNFATRRRHAQEFSPVGPVIGLVRRHAVAVGKLPMDVGVKVGERGPKDIVELSRAVLVRRAAGLRRVVEEVIGEEFVEHFEISAALHFLRVAANDCFCSLAHIVDRHGYFSTRLDGLALPLGKRAGKFAWAHVANLLGCLLATSFASAICSCESEPKYV